MAEDTELYVNTPEEGYVLIRIHVPELNVQKCMQFPKDQLVWDVKQQCLASLPKELKESFNYGLFCPPTNGKAGKFLDEERRLGDYPFNGPVGYLELKYKRRVYKMVNLDEKVLKNLHMRSNLRKLIDHVHNGHVDKITKICTKGLDPNFHCQETGETPLSLATNTKTCAKALIALVNGGALLDFRNKDGSTALHRAVERNSLEAIRTLLELGASPNYKDAKGLTPLYLSVINNTDALICETLLHDHATIGAKDLQGWHEVHQACRNGNVQHLSHLLFYGADMNAQNASGNTPLHVCAVNNQESCARQLLFRGCDRDALNFTNQTPYQVAVIAGNLELAETIRNFRMDDVVPFRGPPSYNPRRRSGINFTSMSTGTHMRLMSPPSPCSSDRSTAPFSSASSCGSSNSGLQYPHPRYAIDHDNASIVTVLAMGVGEKTSADQSDIVSDSSGVGTSNSDTTNCSLQPGSTVVCLENYSSHLPGHLQISQGDIIEVTGTTDCGMLDGVLRGPGSRSGLFPAHCVQEVRLRHGIHPPITAGPSKSILKRDNSQTKHFATTPRFKKSLPEDPRTVVLHRGKRGFGFVLRGAKDSGALKDFRERYPALQYLYDVDEGGVADMAGLKKADFLLAINGEDVSGAPHEYVVDLIRKSGDLVSMTVVSIDACASQLPNSKSTNTMCGDADNVPNSRQYSTLPRKLTSSQSTVNFGRSPAPLPPRRDPKTTLSVSRARAKSLVAGLENGGERVDELSKCSSTESVNHPKSISSGQGTPVAPRTASIRNRPSSSRITATELEELFQRQILTDSERQIMTTSNFQPNVSPCHKPGRIYASVAEMKKNKCKFNSRARFFNARHGGELHRSFHSTPDLVNQVGTSTAPKSHRSQEDVNVLLANGRQSLPPPMHPPPPAPVMGQVVKVEVVRSDYDELSGLKSNDRLKDNAEIISSFRPSANAKLYASPEDIKTVGYRSRSLPSHSLRPNVRKSQSMRTPGNPLAFRPGSSAGSSTLTKSSAKANLYAQPLKPSQMKTSRSNSMLGNPSAIVQNRKKRNSLPACGSTTTPTIPEPDYSLSESEAGDMESEDDVTIGKDDDKGRFHVVNPPAETSGNSNTSGSSSSSGSVSLHQSFSVDEIQKVRAQLKSSKSFPNEYSVQEKVLEAVEDGDNSSSGVSSDQEVISNHVTNDYAIQEKPEYKKPKESHFKTVDKMQNNDKPSNCMTLPASVKFHSQQRQSVLTRNAVSLAQLPPPMEGETEEKDDVFVPPPPEFNESGVGDVVVLAPPPQFSDGKLTARVVGALPKTGKNARAGAI